MSTTTTVKTNTGELKAFGINVPVPVLLVASAPPGTFTVDRCLVAVPSTVGRHESCDFILRDDKVSKRHFKITKQDEIYHIEDLGSTNGTFVAGAPLVEKTQLHDGDVIRVGRSVVVFHSKGNALLEPPPPERYTMAGRFHTGPLLKLLKEASISARHVLLSGSSGTGKELAARALAEMMGLEGAPLKLVAHNAARFASEEEASATLFGVGPRVFSNVDARQGLIESAHEGVLFLDEVHNLPERVQRTLLRVIEDGEVARIGETKTRQAAVRFVLASNAEGPTRGLAHDLFARLRTVYIPAIGERVADIPSIFIAVLQRALKQHQIDHSDVTEMLGGDHYESLCLDGFPLENIRGLVDLADRLATRIALGTDAEEAIASVFGERYSAGPVMKRQKFQTSASISPPPSANEMSTTSSHYERHKDAIGRAIKECGGNLSAAERMLKDQGIRCSRRWLAVFAEQWGLRKSKK